MLSLRGGSSVRHGAQRRGSCFQDEAALLACPDDHARLRAAPGQLGSINLEHPLQEMERPLPGPHGLRLLLVRLLRAPAGS